MRAVSVEQSGRAAGKDPKVQGGLGVRVYGCSGRSKLRLRGLAELGG